MPFVRDLLLKFLERKRIIYFLGSFLILAGYLWIATTPFLLRWEWQILDIFFRLRGPIKQSQDIVFIEITEDSMESIGRFPWPRKYHAVLLEILKQWEAKYVVFDMLFTRPAIDALDDQAFVEALEKTNGVYLPVMFKKLGAKIGLTQSLDYFQNQVEGIGHINIYPDSDGVLRRIDPYLQNPSGTRHPHLSLKVAFDSLGKTLSEHPPFPFPVDDNGKLIINWAGRWTQAFRHYSYADVFKSYNAMRQGLEPIIHPAEIKGAICIIGVNAPGSVDIKPTPLEPLYPGMGIVGTVINSMLTGQYIQPASLKINLQLMFGLWLASLLILIPFRNVLSPTLICLLLAAVASGAYGAFVHHSLWIHVARPLLMILSMFLYTLIWAKFISDKETVYFRNLAIRDGLTGLFNRRRFMELAEDAIAQVKVSGEPITLIMADIDHFKEINDTYGHQAGDMILRGVAQKIQASIRYKRPETQIDYVARYGGEEIIIMLRNAEAAAEGFGAAERIRRSVEAERFYWGNDFIKVTLSLGVAPLLPSDPLTAALERADQALYEAKNAGRNWTCLFKNADSLPSETDKTT